MKRTTKNPTDKIEKLIQKLNRIDQNRKINHRIMNLFLAMFRGFGDPTSRRMHEVCKFKFDIKPYGDDGLTLIRKSPTDLMVTNYWGNCCSDMEYRLNDGSVFRSYLDTKALG